jgi:X-X-X-Leu-X-X-Gly heptad repeat protein
MSYLSRGHSSWVVKRSSRRGQARSAGVWIALVAWSATACGSAGEAMPDAPRSTVPASPAGTFAVTSAYDLAVPAVAAPVITTLTAATDGPDDPCRFVLDRMIASLPDGTGKTIAAGAAPYVAAYLNAQLATIAPKLVDGLNQLSAGMTRIANHVGTAETWTIDAAGNATRTINDFVFTAGDHMTDVRLTDAGLAEVSVATHVELVDDARLVIADHTHALPYGAWLRLGLDLAVVPSVVPEAHDLATALGSLLDCEQLGALVAAQIGLGAPSLYTTACQAAMTVIASEVAGELAAIDQTAMTIEVIGDANGIDDDGDGTMDRLAAGHWTGSVHAGTDETLSAAQFTGAKLP